VAASSFNERAGLIGTLPWNPLQWKIITSSVDEQSSAMGILYGNDLALRYARSNSQGDYPPGSVLSLVTWAEQADPKWFGARIPGQPKSVEFVSVANGADGAAAYSYEEYEGSPLHKTSSAAGRSPESRTAYLLSRRASVMP
jgi:hypothetical protein